MQYCKTWMDVTTKLKNIKMENKKTMNQHLGLFEIDNKKTKSRNPHLRLFGINSNIEGKFQQ
jgi:hypothetical protein